VFADWSWANDFERKALGMALTDLFAMASNLREDQHESTDWKTDEHGKYSWGMRVRRVTSAGRYRDFTLRYSRSSGAETEIDKIRKGAGDFYLYAWVCENEIEEYIIVDLHALRRSELLLSPRTTANRDGKTVFAHWPTSELYEADAIVSGRKYPNRMIQYVWTMRTNRKAKNDAPENPI